MSTVDNPYLFRSSPQPEPAEPTTPSVVRPKWVPQSGVASDITSWLPFRRVEPAGLYVVGAHGGAGGTTVSGLLDGSVDCGMAWPIPPETDPIHVLVVARSNIYGLRAAQAAVRQWASGSVPLTHVVGLTLVADAPGKLPRPIQDLSRHVAGAFPAMWEIPWMPDLREGRAPDRLPRSVARFIDEMKGNLL